VGISRGASGEPLLGPRDVPPPAQGIQRPLLPELACKRSPSLVLCFGVGSRSVGAGEERRRAKGAWLLLYSLCALGTPRCACGHHTPCPYAKVPALHEGKGKGRRERKGGGGEGRRLGCALGKGNADTRPVAGIRACSHLAGKPGYRVSGSLYGPCYCPLPCGPLRHPSVGTLLCPHFPVQALWGAPDRRGPAAGMGRLAPGALRLAPEFPQGSRAGSRGSLTVTQSRFPWALQCYSEYPVHRCLSRQYGSATRQVAPLPLCAAQSGNGATFLAKEMYGLLGEPSWSRNTTVYGVISNDSFDMTSCHWHDASSRTVEQD